MSHKGSETKTQMMQLCIETLSEKHCLPYGDSLKIITQSSWLEMVQESDDEELQWIGHYPFEYWVDYIIKEYRS